VRTLTLLVILLLGAAAHGETLRVAVAANFRATFEALAPALERELGVPLEAIYGSSGLLYAQIRQGAPFGAFLSADAERPGILAAEGLTAGPPQTYAVGRLALWMPGATEVSPQSLAKPGLRFSLANPNLAPYGAAARSCLEQLGLWPALASRAVYGASVNQAFHFVTSGGVEAGFIAHAQALDQGLPATELWLAPADCHAPIEQQAVALPAGGEAAKQLLALLLDPETQRRLVARGYAPAPAKTTGSGPVQAAGTLP
jgi:molybdate transport system substrate-binding protein